jgi:hypothetical protein
MSRRNSRDRTGIDRGEGVAKTAGAVLTRRIGDYSVFFSKGRQAMRKIGREGPRARRSCCMLLDAPETPDPGSDSLPEEGLAWPFECEGPFALNVPGVGVVCLEVEERFGRLSDWSAKAVFAPPSDTENFYTRARFLYVIGTLPKDPGLEFLRKQWAALLPEDPGEQLEAFYRAVMTYLSEQPLRPQ